MPARVFQLQVGGGRLSAIPILTTRGIEDVYETQKSLKSFCFSVYFLLSMDQIPIQL